MCILWSNGERNPPPPHFYSGVHKLVMKYWQFGAAEVFRGAVMAAQVKKLQMYVPELRLCDITRYNGGREGGREKTTTHCLFTLPPLHPPPPPLPLPSLQRSCRS